MPIPCFDIFPDLKDRFQKLITKDMSEDQQREIGKKLALDYHKELHDELNNFKKGLKLKPSEYISPDKSKEIQAIHEKYNPLIEEAAKSNESQPAEKEVPSTGTTPEDQQTAGTGTPPPGEPAGQPAGGSEEPLKVGISHEALSNLAKRLGVKEPERGTFLSPKEQADKGRKLYKEGADISAIMDKVSKGIAIDADEVSILRAHAEELAKKVDDLRKNKSPDYQQAKEDYQNLQTIIKNAGTKAGEHLAAFQGERNMDDGSFTSVSHEIESVTKKPLSDIAEAEVHKLTNEVAAQTKRAEEAEAKLKEVIDNNTGDNTKEKGKYETKARGLAAKIMKAELPKWMRADLPEGTKSAGLDSTQLKKLLADATINVGKLLDKGIEFTEAVKEAVKDIVVALG